MNLPRPVFKGSSESLKNLIKDNCKEEEGRLRRFKEFRLGELFINLRSRDRLSKSRVRSALPVGDDREVVELVSRLLEEAAADYLKLRMQWQREAVGYLTSIGAELFSRLEGSSMEVPSDLDYVGLEAEGAPDRRLSITARRVGNFAGIRARYLDLEADVVGDYCFRRACSCGVSVEMAGKCLGEEGEGLRLRARETGDWLLLKSRRCYVDARRVGRLAGLDSHDLEIHVHYAGAELGARARDAVIYVYRDAKSLGLRGSGIVYMSHGTPPWHTSFHMEIIP
ncbi:MAG: hypothetical protein SWK76_06475 [Actinomycetota bacterium]|nr:hypothetical protein [Actinomycetota bacterium]